MSAASGGAQFRGTDNEAASPAQQHSGSGVASTGAVSVAEPPPQPVLRELDLSGNDFSGDRPQDAAVALLELVVRCTSLQSLRLADARLSTWFVQSYAQIIMEGYNGKFRTSPTAPMAPIPSLKGSTANSGMTSPQARGRNGGSPPKAGVRHGRRKQAALAGLQSRTLADAETTAALVVSLTQSASWPLPLTRLDLSGNPLTEAAATAISAMLALPTMTLNELFLSRSLSEPESEGTAKLVGTLAGDSGRRLRALELEGCALDDATLADPLRRLLLTTSSLVRLNLARNRLGGDSADVLVEGVCAATCLRELVLSNNPLGLIGCTDLIAAATHSGLELLRLDGAATSLTRAVDHEGLGLRSARLWEQPKPVRAAAAGIGASAARGKAGAAGTGSTTRNGPGVKGSSATAAASATSRSATITQESLALGLFGDSAQQFLWELADVMSQTRAERMPQTKVMRVVVEWPEIDRVPVLDILSGDPSLLARLSPRAAVLLRSEGVSRVHDGASDEDGEEWRPENSVFRDRQFVAPSRSMLDTEELVAMTLEADWTATHLHTLLLDRASQEEVKAVLAEHYAFLIQLFHFYCSFDQTPFQMKHVVFTDWRKRCGLFSSTDTAVEALMDAAFRGSDFGPGTKNAERKARLENDQDDNEGSKAEQAAGSGEDVQVGEGHAASRASESEPVEEAPSGALTGGLAPQQPGDADDEDASLTTQDVLTEASAAVNDLESHLERAEQAARASASNKADVNSRHALTRHEFIEALVRMAVAIEGVKVVGASSALATAAAVRAVIRDRLAPVAYRDLGLTLSKNLFANAFREDFLYTKAVDTAVRKQLKLISELHEYYAGDLLVRGGASVGTGFGLTAKGWQAMLSDARMLNSTNGISRPEANAHFAAAACVCHYEGFPDSEAARQCGVLSKDERARLTNSRTLTKTEFLELLCRVAASPSATVFLPRSEVAGAGKRPGGAKAHTATEARDAGDAGTAFTADELAHMPLPQRVGYLVHYLYSRTLGLKTLGTSAGKQRFVMYEVVDSKLAAAAVKIMQAIVRTQIGQHTSGFAEMCKGRVYAKTQVGSCFSLVRSLKI